MVVMLTRRKRSALVAVAAMCLGMGKMTVGSATEQEAITVPPDGTAEGSYPGLVMGVNVTGEAEIRPATCRSVVYCDTIPVDIRVPSDLAEDSYLVTITLSFEVTGEHNAADQYTQPETDLDMYLWADEDDTTPVGAGWSLDEPEVVRVIVPRSHQYLLVVHNAFGQNDSYHLNFTGNRIDESFTPPIDASDRRPTPPKQPPSGTIGNEVEGEAVALPSGGPVGPAGAPSMAPGPVAPIVGDPDFATPLDSRSAVDVVAEDLARSTRRSLKPKPILKEPPASALLIWLVVVPAAAVAGERLLFRRRSRRALPTSAA